MDQCHHPPCRRGETCPSLYVAIYSAGGYQHWLFHSTDSAACLEWGPSGSSHRSRYVAHCDMHLGPQSLRVQKTCMVLLFSTFVSITARQTSDLT